MFGGVVLEYFGMLTSPVSTGNRAEEVPNGHFLKILQKNAILQEWTNSCSIIQNLWLQMWSEYQKYSNTTLNFQHSRVSKDEYLAGSCSSHLWHRLSHGNSVDAGQIFTVWYTLCQNSESHTVAIITPLSAPGGGARHRSTGVFSSQILLSSWEQETSIKLFLPHLRWFQQNIFLICSQVYLRQKSVICFYQQGTSTCCRCSTEFILKAWIHQEGLEFGSSLATDEARNNVLHLCHCPILFHAFTI